MNLVTFAGSTTIASTAHRLKKLRRIVASSTVTSAICLDNQYEHVALPAEFDELWVPGLRDCIVTDPVLNAIDPRDYATLAILIEDAKRRPFGAATLRRASSGATETDGAVDVRVFDLLNDHGIVLALMGTFDDDSDDEAATAPRMPRVLKHRCDTTGHYLRVDPNTPLILGWEPADIVGRSGLEFLHPGDRDIAVAGWLSALATQTAARQRCRWRTSEGGWRWVELAYRNELGDDGSRYIEVEMLDLRAEVDALSQTRATASRFETLALSLPVGVVQMNAEGAVTFTNHWIEEATGVVLRGKQARTLLEAVHPDDRGIVAEKFYGCRNGTDADFTLRMRHIDSTDYRRYEVRLRCLAATHDQGGMIAAVQDITDTETTKSALRHQARTDYLTGLPNRADLTKCLNDLIAERAETEEKFACLFIDLDAFKLVNDGLGHQGGDQLLVGIGERLRQAVRRSDFVARVGGDEFVALCPWASTRDDLEPMIERVMETLQEPITISGITVNVSVSVGIAFHDAPGLSAERIIGNADLAMYSAKRSGGSRFAFYEPSMRETMEQRFDLQRSMRKALDNDEFRMHLQPVYDMATDSVVGAEALIRWCHPTRGMIPPGYFIDYVARSELMVELGWWIINESCRIAARVVRSGAPRFRLAINVTGGQLSEPNFAQKMLDTVARHGLGPGNLALEITETVIISDGRDVIDTLELLSNAGCVISLDDFGTGYSSLNHLRDIPVGAIKIDRSYTARLHDDEATRTIVVLIRDLALQLGLKIIVEGVETEDDRALLLDLGFKVGQGYLMARPCDEETFLHNYAPAIADRTSSAAMWGFGDDVISRNAAGDAATQNLVL